jgi:hypothetical protein
MSSDPIPEDETPEIDDGTLSEVIRKPTRTAGDLSEMAEGSAEIATEDVARDLEAAASTSRTVTERELLEEVLERVNELAESVRRMERHSDEISQLSERISKIERKIASSPSPRNVDSSPPVEPAVPPGLKPPPVNPPSPPPPLKPPAPSKGVPTDPANEQ